MIFLFYSYTQLVHKPKLTCRLYSTKRNEEKGGNIFQPHLETFSNPSSIFSIRSAINSITLIPGKRNKLGGDKLNTVVRDRENQKVASSGAG